MSERRREIDAFLNAAGWGDAKRVKLAADASSRSYERLMGPKGRAILMNAPVENGALKSPAAMAYNHAAHLAEDCQPFVAIDVHLRRLGLSAPKILAADTGRGLLLLEDLGDDLFASVLAGGGPEAELYAAAVDVLLALHGADTRPSGLAAYDSGALAAEVALLSEWYAPLALQSELGARAQNDYRRIWRDLFPALLSGPQVLVLRDYHAQNLFWLPGRNGVARVGLIDFQDALLGSPAYDLVSLLQDARRDVSPQCAASMLSRYCRLAAGRPGFDAAAFRAAYALAGAQRNCKILGIFARLARRDGKAAYLGLLPRVRAYLRAGLAHPALAPLNQWFAANLPLVIGDSI